MIKSIILSIVAFSALQNCSVGQSIDTSISDKLSHLNQIKRPVPKYVNFDVVKIASGPGFVTHIAGDKALTLNFRLQVLYPKAILKDVFPIAIGLMVGSQKFKLKDATPLFNNGKFASVESSPQVASLQRSKYVGITFLPVIRLNFITVLAGPSLNYHFYNRLRTMGDHESSSNINKYVNRVRAPVHLQVSFSRRQFLSIGLSGSYDMTPTYKNVSSVHQGTIALTGAIIL